MITHSSILAQRIPMDKGHWRESLWGCKESDMTEQLSTWLSETKLVFFFS